MIKSSHSKKIWTSPKIFNLNHTVIKSGKTTGGVEAVFFSNTAGCGVSGTIDPNATTNPIIMQCNPACGSAQLFLMVTGRTVATPNGLCS